MKTAITSLCSFICLLIPLETRACRIPDWAAIRIQRDEIYFGFEWDPQYGPTNCEDGTAVEFEIVIYNEDPPNSTAQKCFAQPPGGRDDDLKHATLFNFLGYTDVGNFFTSYSAGELADTIEEECGESFDFAAYVGTLTNSLGWETYAHFAVGTIDPQQFVPGQEYGFYYPLEIPTVNIDGEPCDFTGVDWGYALINMEILPNTCNLPVFYEPSHCPFLLGYEACAEENSLASWRLLNRICAPTDTFSFRPYNTMAGEGTECVDEDGDGLFAVQNSLMFGTNIGDCEDYDDDIGNSLYDPSFGVCYPELISPANNAEFRSAQSIDLHWKGGQRQTDHIILVRQNPDNNGPLVVERIESVWSIHEEHILSTPLLEEDLYQWTVCYPDPRCVDGSCCGNVRRFEILPAVCTPDCTGKECGNDGCGELCGTCPNGENCSNGICIPNSQCVGEQRRRCWVECGQDVPNGCETGSGAYIMGIEACQSGDWGECVTLTDCSVLSQPCSPPGTTTLITSECVDGTIQNSTIACLGGGIPVATCNTYFYSGWAGAGGSSDACQSMCLGEGDKCSNNGETRSCEVHCNSPSGPTVAGVQECSYWGCPTPVWGPCETGHACNP